MPHIIRQHVTPCAAYKSRNTNFVVHMSLRWVSSQRCGKPWVSARLNDIQEKSAFLTYPVHKTCRLQCMTLHASLISTFDTPQYPGYTRPPSLGPTFSFL